MLVLVSWHLQKPFLLQAGKALEPSMEYGDFQAKQIEESKV